MTEKNKEQRPDLIYECMDATDLTYADEKFTVVLDKGTLDALMPDTNDETVARIDKFFNVSESIRDNAHLRLFMHTNMYIFFFCRKFQGSLNEVDVTCV